MITIDTINQNGFFPVIEFTLQNTGLNARQLREMRIEVQEVAIDTRPSFCCALDIGEDTTEGPEYDTLAGDLIITLSNNGWGGAVACDLQLAEKTLQQLFAPELLRSKLELSGGQSGQAFVLKAGQADMPAMKQMLFSDMQTRQARGLAGTTDVNTHALSLSMPVVHVSYCESGSRAAETARLMPDTQNLPGNLDGALSLRHDAFQWQGDHAKFCMHAPFSLHYAKLDLTRGAHTRGYRVEHRMEPGAAERFRIMLGGQLSARVKLFLRILMDDGQSVASDPVEVAIWHPRGVKIPYFYQECAKADAGDADKPERDDCSRPQTVRHHWEKEELLLPLLLLRDED